MREEQRAEFAGYRATSPHLSGKERDFQHLLLKEMEGEEDGEEGAVVFTKGPLRQFVHFPTALAHLPKRHERKEDEDGNSTPNLKFQKR